MSKEIYCRARIDPKEIHAKAELGQTVIQYVGEANPHTVVKTGAVQGSGTTILQIPCDFEPDLIHIHGDLSADVTNRGIATLTIIKDMDIYIGNDSSTSGTAINFSAIQNITGYNESDISNTHATYLNNTLSIDTVVSSSAWRWTSGITYEYKLIKFG